MRSACSLIGPIAIFVTSSLGCALGGFRRSFPPPPPPDLPSEDEASIDTRALVLAAMNCWLAPAVYHAPPWAPEEEVSAAFGPETGSCTAAAQAVHVRPLRLYRLDADATFEIRRRVTRTPSIETSPREVSELLSFLDKGLAAIAEGRHAYAEIMRAGAGVSPSIDKLRAHRAVAELDDFGRMTEGLIGVQARSVAMVVLANNFLQIARVDEAVRPFAAEPLFTTLFGAEFLSDKGSTEPPARWNEYVAAAARSIEVPAALSGHDLAAPSVGGGPREFDGRESLRAVTSLVGAQMRALAQQLPAGDISSDVERTIARYATFDVGAAVSQSVAAAAAPASTQSSPAEPSPASTEPPPDSANPYDDPPVETPPRAPAP
ncbi:MAG TPA: hypothetical protein VJT73_06090 [Polyangiaceae bacterium]|nr:hypothetical protein [Polyangiaceae bacterium]